MAQVIPDSTVSTYRAVAGAGITPALPLDLLQTLSALSERAVCSRGDASSGASAILRDGLARSIRPDLLSEWMELPGACLQVCSAESRIHGFSIVFLDSRSLPRNLSPLSKRATALHPFVYAHLIVVAPEYRGHRYGVYDRLMEAGMNEIPPGATSVLAWVRLDNQHAIRSHLSRGWYRTGVYEPMTIEGLSYESEFFVRPLALNLTTIRERLAQSTV